MSEQREITVIICKDCGYQNEEGDAFCGSCGSFLEWTGAKVEEAERGYAYDVSDEPVDEGALGKVKKALAVDDDSLAAHESTQERVAADDAAMAASIVAQREAEEEAARQAAAEAEAKRLMDAAEAERAAAEKAAGEAQARAEEARRDAERRAEEAERRAEEERARRESEAAQAVAEAEERARRESEERRAREEAEAAAAQERLTAERAAADAAAEAARLAEEAAERERVAAEEKVREAAANAAAAALRAMEEQDARAAAEAAKAQAEAEAAQARAEAEAAKAAAAEETARAKAELEQARAEAARLKAEAEEREVQQRLDAQRARAEAEAREEAEAARRRAEAEADAKRRIEEAEAEAAARRAREEAEAATRAAEAEAARLRSEAEAAASKAAAEKARQEAEAIEARRAREAALEKAAALVGKPVAEKPAEAPKAPATKPGKQADKPAAAAVAGEEGTPAGQKPGQTKARPAPVTKSAPSKEINHGDLVCGHCGEGNPPSRKFCRRCGESLKEAVAVELSFWKKVLRALRPKPKQYEAGQRKGRGGKRGTGVRDARSKSQVLFFRLNTWLFRIGAILGVVAVLGFGVEPIRQKLRLPNVREQAINKIKNVLTPKFDPVRPVGATGASEKEHAAGLAVDLVSNSFWSPPPSGDGGVGGTLRVRFERPFDLARMLVTSGTAGTDAENGFVSRPRINELELIVNGDVAGSKRITLKDIDKPQTIKQSLKGITTLDMKVVSVYPAATPTNSSVAISEIEFFEKRKFGDNYETLKPSKVVASAGDAKALADGDLSTSWITDESKPGVGQSFTISFAEPTDVDRIRIAPGRAGDDYRRTPRPKDLQFVFTCDPACEPTGQSSVEDSEGFHSVGQSRKKVRSIQVQIRTVNGDEGAGGVAIAEVEVQRKRPS